VIAYFILNGALTLWIYFAEKGKIFNGSLGGKRVRYVGVERMTDGALWNGDADSGETDINCVECDEAYPNL